MSRSLWTPWAGMIGLVLAGGCAGSGNASSKSGGPTPLPTATAPTTARMDDFQTMLAVVTFTPSQREQFLRKLEERNAAYDKWLKGPQGRKWEQVRDQYAQAQKARDKTKAAELEPQAKAMAAEQAAVRLQLRKEFNKVLTLPQQRQYAAWRLYQHVAGRLKLESASEQARKQALAICTETAEAKVGPNTIDQDPYLALDLDTRKAVVEKIKEKVQK